MAPTTPLPFLNRTDAGRQLAAKLAQYSHHQSKNLLILTLPRGGVPVGAEVAKILNAPLDVFTIRKLGVPGNEELAFGAIASGNTQILNDDIIQLLNISQSTIDQIAAKERAELFRRENVYRPNRPPIDTANRTVILIDDGLATGASMRAAAIAVRRMNPARLIIAVPVAAAETCDLMRSFADELVCLYMPEPFLSVSFWYKDFSPTTDADVLRSINTLKREFRRYT